jgi:hypothetical protein
LLHSVFTRAALAALSVGVLAVGVPAASAHDESLLVDDGAINSAKDTHVHDQHGGHDGHLDPVSRNVAKIGSLDLFAGAEEPGRIGDVSAKGNYAYLTVFREPTCERGGVQVVDISDPANPKKGPYIPSHQGTYAGEGSQVISMNTKSFKGDVLVYNNEICAGREQQGVGGVTLVDVTNPLKPKKLVEGFGDFTLKGKAQTHSNQVHSAFAWTGDNNRSYVIMTDNEEVTDTDIIEITNPSRPKFVAEYDWTPQSKQGVGDVHGDAVFIHDEVVKKIGDQYVALLSYWDGGYIKMNVTDPANATFMDDTDYAAADPVRFGFGQTISPEGNAHQAEFTRDNELFVATDEDFDPYRVVAEIKDGPAAGTEFTAIQGSEVPRIDSDTSIAGDTRFVGLACTAVPAADADHKIAVIERGVCDFTVKVQIVEAAGYEGAIVFNRTGVDGCETLISMLVEAGIPAIFVSRKDGFRILGESVADADYSCSDGEDAAGTPAPAAGGDASEVDVRAIFDGWGYVHLFDADTMADLDQYYIPESQDPDMAEGHGDLSVHEVATDPDADLAYISYYSGGLRVLKYRDAAGNPDLTEAGAYIAEGGNNFWGVEVHKHPNGQKYVLASDRDSGVWIFQYTGG